MLVVTRAGGHFGQTRRAFLATGAAFVLMGAPALAQGRPVVICVSYPLAWFAERLAGDLADIRFPVPNDVDPSFWRPEITDISAIQTADLIVLNGAGFAAWTTKTTLPRSRTVDTSAGFADAYIATGTVTHSHGADGEHSHTGTASYTWLDFALANRQAETLTTALERLLPDAAPDIEDNFVTLSTDLATLDATAREIGAMATNVPIIASHPRYQYFAQAYGLDLTSVEWDAREPATDEQWTALEQQIIETSARMFIWEAEPSPDARDRMAALGLISVVFPPLANSPETGDFLTVMEKALSDLRSALVDASP